MKRLIAVVLIAVMMFSACACTGENNTSSSQVPGVLTLNGVNVEEYAIVVPENCDRLTYFAAEILFQYLFINKGVALSFVTDKSPETECEILFGETNREESSAAASTEIPEGSYLLTSVGYKIVMLGDTYLIGGGASELINDYFMKDLSATVKENAEPKHFEFDTPDSAILMIADGMGPNHILAAKGEGLGIFYPETLPAICEVYTYNVYGDVTDSAAAATAMGTGVKTSNGRLGMDKDGVRLKNMTELVSSKGGKVALATTDAIHGATPSGFAVHAEERGMTDSILEQYENLISLGKLSYAKGDLGGSLCLQSTMALRDISMDGSKFFMMIEEAKTDHCSHSNDYEGMVNAVKRFNEVTAYCIEYAVIFPRIALLITADHETGGLTETASGFEFTTTNHSGTNVKLFALGGGTERFRQRRVIENIEIAQFNALIFGEKNFGR